MKVEKTNQMPTWAIVLVSIIAFLLFSMMVIYSYVVGKYNTFVVAGQDIDTQLANVKTEYQRRADLFINLAEVATSYAKFEKDTLTQVTQARASATQISTGALTGSRAEQLSQLQGFDSALSRLLLVFEKYPELKAVEQYNQVLQEVQRTENRIQIARSDYNAVIRSYNILISTFPANLLAGNWGYDKEVFFDNEPGTSKAPKLDMGLPNLR